MSRQKQHGQITRPRPKQPLPEDFVCIAPEESLMVFDYLYGRRNVDKRLVALHVNLCDQCQENVKTLKNIDETLKEQLLVMVD